MKLTVILALLVAGASADEPSEETQRLKRQVKQLQQENQQLREKLNAIARLAAPLESRPPEQLNIVIQSGDWGDAASPDILKVHESSASPLWKSSGNPHLHRISVIRDSEGPLVAYQRGQDNAYRVLLNVKGRLWSQFSYQFSHEMCHILCNYRDAPNKQKWFEESLCECASLYSLRSMGQSWKTAPPYSNWKSYSDSLTQYATNRMNAAKNVPDGKLTRWYEQHRTQLEESAVRRDLNLVVALKLLPIFERHPHSWKAVRTLNLGDPDENQSLRSYLQGWLNRTDSDNKKVVAEVATIFGFNELNHSDE